MLIYQRVNGLCLFGVSPFQDGSADRVDPWSPMEMEVFKVQTIIPRFYGDFMVILW